MNYKEVRKTLGTRISRKLCNNTYLYRDPADESKVMVKLHGTNVVTHGVNGVTVYDSGGWKTSTTKDRMNGYGADGWRIHQDKGVWYIVNGAQKAVFKDGLKITAIGRIIGADKTAKDVKLQKQIVTYCKGFIEALFQGKVPAPNNGDCWFCHMRTVDGNKPLGDVTKNVSHLKSHLVEKYYVPSMLMNAIEQYPVSQFTKGELGQIWKAKYSHNCLVDIARRQLLASLRRYLRHQFGLAGN